MTIAVNVRFEEDVLVGLLAQAMSKRISRDYDTLDDIRTNREILQDLVRRAKTGDGDLLKYLQEMLDGDQHELAGAYHVSTT